MNIDEIIFLWTVRPPENFVENSELKCSECGEWSNHKDWTEGEAYCEDCGGHAAMICPECGEVHNHIHHEGFECRLPKNYQP